MCRNNNTENQFNESLCCDEKVIYHKKSCGYCYTPTEFCIHSRRCFMTGEYCSKQPSIQRERKKLYDGKNKSIKAFVIMNFSDMSDVVYKWRLRTFVESLKKYLYIDEKRQRLYCSVAEDDRNMKENNRVKEIQVVRSDSEPASNYVICSRICQQMQIADLVIVDVSHQNANVFYEFGMAVALGKMILPICYSESFYKMVIPKKLEDKYWDLPNRENLERHIGFYPWRKDLFEYYGIRFKDDTKTEYLDFEEVIKPEYGFSDNQYNRFPYHECLAGDTEKVGKKIYDKLKTEYNEAEADGNTLVVYTMDSFLNEGQAGRCIVNFYRNITARMSQEKCFCGERVGVLVQGNVIPESEKDSKDQIDIFYNVGEIIHIGMNQATYLAAEEKIKSDEDFSELIKKDGTIPAENQQYEIERFVKGHIKNRAMRVYPNHPVFVDRMKNLLHKDLLKVEDDKDDGNKGNQEKEQICSCFNLSSFCLYHVMLRTLRYTNELVVDISGNCLQSLFWLGAAHGSDIYAITVMHEKTESEKKINPDRSEKENRYVFDVAGLWMAILKKNDTEGFYKQLASVQNGIELHSKLMLPNSEYYKKQILEYLLSFNGTTKNNEWEKNISGLMDKHEKEKRSIPEELYRKKKEEETNILESYYRNRFWAPMLSYNRLSIYLSQRNEVDENKEPRLCMATWDFKAISVLSHYLSKRKVIGEYFLVSLPKGQGAKEAKEVNFISVGSDVEPLGEGLPEYIYRQIQSSSFDKEKICGINIVHKKKELPTKKACSNGHLNFKGFKCIEKDEKDVKGIFTHQPQANTCVECKNDNTTWEKETEIFYSEKEIEESCCFLRAEGIHYEIAQLILWREQSPNPHMRSYFRVAINGSSGPATFALSALFVDKNQKDACFKNSQTANHLLCDLQKIVRRKFMDVFFETLQEKLDALKLEACNDTKKIIGELENSQKKRYLGLVRYTVASYLRTVLYRYFFPFLSENDMDRIYNGMDTFINSMKAARVSPFALDYHSNREREFSSFVSNDSINQVVEVIPETLLSVLKSFKGLEAFYMVGVKHQLDSNSYSNEDTRDTQQISMMKGNVPNVNCFFI